MGIHYDYKSTRGAKAMEKQAKREKKLAERRAKELLRKVLNKQKVNLICMILQNPLHLKT